MEINYQNNTGSRKSLITIFMVTLFISGFISGCFVANELKKKNLLYIINDITSIISNLNVEHSINLLLKWVEKSEYLITTIIVFVTYM